MSFFSLRTHQYRRRLGFRPDPTRGAYSAPQTPYSRFQGAASRQEGNGGKD